MRYLFYFLNAKLDEPQNINWAVNGSVRDVLLHVNI